MTDLANITTLPSGRSRVRIEYGGRVLGGVEDTEQEAIDLRDALRRQIADEEMVPITGATLVHLTASFLASRDKNRASKDDSGRWHRHIKNSKLGRMPVAAIETSDVVAWLEALAKKETGFDPKKHGKRLAKKISWQTRKHCLNLLRRFFAWAITKSHVKSNPCVGVQVEREDGDDDEGFQDSWYLDADEQARALTLLANDPERWIVAFALGTGVRQGEQWCLHLADVHADEDETEPHVIIRFGSWDPVKERYRSPKGRKGEKHSRKVPLFGLGLDAARAWLKALPTYAPKNPLGLMFPTPSGCLRKDKPPACWETVRDAFGVLPRIGRKPWWHLLRHSCASSLVSGWWGSRWRLEDVRAVLGHTDIKTTQRYAHLAPDAVVNIAADAHTAWIAVQESRHGAVTPNGRGKRKTLKFPWRATEDSNLRPTAPEAVALSS